MLGGFIVLTIGRSRRDGFNPMRIILAGAAVSALLTAFESRYLAVFQVRLGNNLCGADLLLSLLLLSS